METRDDRQEYKKKKAITTSFRIFVPGISSDISNAGDSAVDAITSSEVTAFLIRYTAEKFDSPMFWRITQYLRKWSPPIAGPAFMEITIVGSSRWV